MDLKTAIHEFLVAGRAEGRSIYTTRTYNVTLGSFAWFANREGWDKDIAEITATRVREFLVYLRDNDHRFDSDSRQANKPVNSTTLRNYYRVLSAMFNWLIREEVLDESPMDKVQTPPAERKVIQALTSAQVNQLLQACGERFSGVRNRAVISTLVDCGLRLGELVGLKIDDVDMDSQQLRVDGKTGERRARFGSTTAAALQKYLDARRACGASSLWVIQKGTPLTTAAVQTAIRKIGARAGVAVHIHLLRHTFATMFLRNGGDAFMLQRLMGHTTLPMTERYVQAVGMEDALKSHETYGPMDSIGKET